MMKKRYFAAVAVCVMAMSMFTGCAGNDGKDIGKDAAKTAAFSDAGVTEDEITRLKVSKDHDDGRSIYEVDFTVASTGEEYDYEISAEDGSILQVDKEMDKGSVSTTQNQDQNASENSTQQGSSNTANQTEAAISEEEATNLALERVPGASAQDLRIQLEFDDGVQKYEGDIIYDGKEYQGAKETFITTGTAPAAETQSTDAEKEDQQNSGGFWSNMCRRTKKWWSGLFR